MGTYDHSLNNIPLSKLQNDLKLFYTLHKLHKYNEKVLLCRNCQRFGHSLKYCRNQTVCLKCSDNHQSKECQVTKYKCNNCGLAHMANSTDCPHYKTEVTILEKIEALKISRYDAIAIIKGRKTFADITAQLAAPQANFRDPFLTLSTSRRPNSTEQPQQPSTKTDHININSTQVLKKRQGTPLSITLVSKYKKEQPCMSQKFKHAYKDILIPSQHHHPTIFSDAKAGDSTRFTPTVKLHKQINKIPTKESKNPNKLPSFRMVEETKMKQMLEVLHSLIPCLSQNDQPKMLHTIKLLSSAYNETS